MEQGDEVLKFAIKSSSTVDIDGVSKWLTAISFIAFGR
jgi:hypothetical protein